MLLDDIIIIVESDEVKVVVDEPDADIILKPTSDLTVSVSDNTELQKIILENDATKVVVGDFPDLDFVLDAPPDVIVVAAGNIGAQGPEGKEGKTGPPGPTGLQGPKGNDSTVPGPPGPAGSGGR